MVKQFYNRIRQGATLVVLVALCLESIGQTSFNCSNPISLSGCNYVPNPGFSLVNSQITIDAFYNNIPDWGQSHGTPDVNRFISPPANLTHANFANMGIGATIAGGQIIDQFSEGIAAQITPLAASRTYALSFFLATTTVSSQSAASVRFNVILMKCEDYVWTNDYAVPPKPQPSQSIYCETMLSAGNTGWKQVFISFIPDDDYDMIWVFPDYANAPRRTQSSFFNFAYPELIEVSNFTAGDSPATGNCNVTIGPSPANCSVTNAQFTWKDPSNNVISQGAGQSTTINLGSPQGNYTLSMTVPGAAVTNNTCSDNAPVIESSVFVPYVCSCDNNGLQIINPSASYYRWDAITGTYSTYPPYVQSLTNCSENTLCYNWNEYLGLTLSSNQQNGNHWEFFISNPNFTFDAFNFTQGNEYSQSIDGFFGISPNENAVIEIRLTNSILNTVKSLYMRVMTPSGASSYCYSIDPNYEYKMIGNSGGDQSFSYSWSFPLGMIVSDLSVQLPNFSFGTYSGNLPASASLQVTNSYCPSYSVTIPLYPGNPYCSARVGSDSNMGKNSELISSTKDLQPSSEVILYPNPVLSSFQIKTDKKIASVTIYSPDGRVMKRNATYRANNLFDVTDLSSGIFMTQIIFQDGTRMTKLFLKK